MKELKDYSIKDHPAYGMTIWGALSIGFLIGLVVGYRMGEKGETYRYGDSTYL